MEAKKMKKSIIGIFALLILLIGLVSASAANSIAVKKEQNEITSVSKVVKENVPSSYSDAEKKVSILPVPVKYLMWTNDGNHIMWGKFGRGYFVGTDNMGKTAWGIYYGGVFAGFYDGNFFSGKYSRSDWKAENLFGEKYSYGKYITFPQPILTATAESIK